MVLLLEGKDEKIAELEDRVAALEKRLADAQLMLHADDDIKTMTSDLQDRVEAFFDDIGTALEEE